MGFDVAPHMDRTGVGGAGRGNTGRRRGGREGELGERAGGEKGARGEKGEEKGEPARTGNFLCLWAF